MAMFYYYSSYLHHKTAEIASMMTIIRRFCNKYRNFLEFNKNLILSGTVAFFVSAAITQLYSKYDNNDFWISTVSILTGFSISIPLFAFLFYTDNKHSRKDKSFRTVIIKKLVALYSISNNKCSG
jgi:O-antigen/teichoic acid export membrane protein